VALEWPCLWQCCAARASSICTSIGLIGMNIYTYASDKITVRKYVRTCILI
jgi:hypothetical protein